MPSLSRWPGVSVGLITLLGLMGACASDEEPLVQKATGRAAGASAGAGGAAGRSTGSAGGSGAGNGGQAAGGAAGEAGGAGVGGAPGGASGAGQGGAGSAGAGQGGMAGGGAGMGPIAPLVLSKSAFSVGEAETSLAVSPDGSLAAVWQDFAFGYPVGYRISHDNGASWGEVQTIDAPTPQRPASNVAVAADPAGNFWAAFCADESPGGDTKIYVAKAPAGAGSFGTPVEVSDPMKKERLDKTWISVGKDGTIYVSYWNPETSQMTLSTSHDGVSWTQTGPGKKLGALPSTCASATSDRVWMVNLSSDGLSIDLQWSDDHGASWLSPNDKRLADKDPEPLAYDAPACVAQGDEVWVVYGLSSDPRSERFQNLSAIRLAHLAADGSLSVVDAHDAPAAALFLHPRIAVEPGGEIDLVYYAGHVAGDKMGTFRHARSTSKGASFGPSETIFAPIQLLNAAVGSNLRLGAYPAVVWHEGIVSMAYGENAETRTHVAFSQVATP